LGDSLRLDYLGAALCQYGFGVNIAQAFGDVKKKITKKPTDPFQVAQKGRQGFGFTGRRAEFRVYLILDFRFWIEKKGLNRKGAKEKRARNERTDERLFGDTMRHGVPE
jgi:hypothetical protein